jgi:hypothetical protein
MIAPDEFIGSGGIGHDVSPTASWLSSPLRMPCLRRYSFAERIASNDQ